MSVVYAVGSNEGHFIIDRIFDEKEMAVAYCMSRSNDKVSWTVYKAPLGAAWYHWDWIFTQPILVKIKPIPMKDVIDLVASCEEV